MDSIETSSNHTSSDDSETIVSAGIDERMVSTWGHALDDYVRSTLREIGDGARASFLTALAGDVRESKIILKQLDDANPAQLPQLEATIGKVLDDLASTLALKQPLYREYLERRVIQDKEAVAKARRATKGMVEAINELNRAVAKAKGQDPDSVEPVLETKYDGIPGLLGDIAQDTRTREVGLIEDVLRQAEALRRKSMMLQWPLRIAHFVVFVMVFAIGADLLTSSVPGKGLHFLAVVALWIFQEFWLVKVVDEPLTARRRANLVKLAVSLYQAKIQLVCDLANWDHKISRV
jgi:hypothetical protein